MNVKDTLKAISATKGWTWDYGRSDYHNLIDAKAFKGDASQGYGVDETIMAVDPITVSGNQTQEIQSVGRMMILTRSNHDMTYEQRYTLFIEPLIAEALSIKKTMKCTHDVIRFEIKEVINFFDFNCDGILINYTFKGYE